MLTLDEFVSKYRFAQFHMLTFFLYVAGVGVVAVKYYKLIYYY